MVMKSIQDRICRDVADPLNGARLCQQGLQFFPDKAVALRDGYSPATIVWRSLQCFSEDSHCRRITAARYGSSLFGCKSKRFSYQCASAAIDRFVVDHLAATPVATAVEAIDAEARKQVGASVVEQLLSYADGDCITYPEETYVLTAQVR